MEPRKTCGRVAVRMALGIEAQGAVPPSLAGEEHQRVALADSHSLALLGLFKVFRKDADSGFEPIDASQGGYVEEYPAGDHTGANVVDRKLRRTAHRCDRRAGEAVVHLPVPVDMAEAVEVSVRAVRDHPDPLPHCTELATPHAFTDDHVPLERRAALERIPRGGIEIAPERDRDPFRYQRSGVS